MSLRNITFPEENPFYKIKFRHTLGWLFLFGFAVVLQLSLFANSRKFNIKDPFLEIIFGTLIYVFICAWIWHQLETLEANPRRLVGKIPQKPQWRSVLLLVICRAFFSIGSGLLIYHVISLIFPLSIENILNQSLKINESKIIQPWLYSILRITYLVLTSILVKFYIQGFLLHRWSTKWGVKSALIAMCVVSGIGGYPNIIGSISITLIYSLLYIKTRTLIIPIVAQLLDFVILRIYWQLFPMYSISRNLSLLEGLRSLWWMEVIMVLLSLPYLLNFVYKNCQLTTEENLPYFANACEY